MKPSHLLIGILLLAPLAACAQGDAGYDAFFLNATMRIDYFHIGDAESEIVTIDKIYSYGIWAGSRTHVIDRFNNGKYSAKIFDADSGNLLFARGFDSYFGEYQTSGPAARSVKRTFHETAIIPLPKRPVRFVLQKRDRLNELQEIFSARIDPADISIIRDKVIDPSVQIVESHTGGDPHSRVDLAIVGEGYTQGETAKFKADVERFTNIFFRYEPYLTMKDSFNIRGVLKPSQESGSDEPRAGLYKNTTLNSSFNALGSERYLLTEDNRTLRDIAAHIPYDAVLIMINHTRYGGGGIYNFYSTFTADTQFHEYIFIHEFGHSFTGLADEYYTSTVAYNDFYPKGLEPLEANITALLDPENLKWKHMVDVGTALPTPWEKAEFDKKDLSWQKRRAAMNDEIAALKRSGAPAGQISAAEREYELADREHSNWVGQYLAGSRFQGVVGAFEGAGYSSQGLYRPMVDCIMFSKGNKPFCKVCEAAIRAKIRFYMD